MKSTVKIVKYQENAYIYYSNKGRVYRHHTQVRWSERNIEKNKISIDKDMSKMELLRAEYYDKNRQQPSIEYIKYNMKNSEKINKSDIENVFDKFLEYKKTSVKSGSLWNWKSFKTTLFDFITTKNISFEIIDEDMFYSFIEYLNSKGYIDNYSKNLLRNFKHFILVSVDLGLIPDKNLKVKITDIFMKRLNKKFYNKRKEFVIITDEELYFLISKRGTLKYNRNVKLDMFIFQLLTGWRFSDLFRFNLNNIENDILTIKSKKTSKDIRIKLDPVLKNILEDNHYCFKTITNPSYNRVLKLILKDFSEDCPSLKKDHIVIEYRGGVDKEIAIKKPKYEFVGSHTFRRSFITNAYEKGYSIKDIGKSTAQADKTIYTYISQTENVADISSKLLEGLENYNNKNLTKREIKRINDRKKLEKYLEENKKTQL